MAAAKLALGYVLSQSVAEDVFMGGAMVTDAYGLPLEFRYTEPVRATKLPAHSLRRRARKVHTWGRHRGQSHQPTGTEAGAVSGVRPIGTGGRAGVRA